MTIRQVWIIEGVERSFPSEAAAKRWQRGLEFADKLADNLPGGMIPHANDLAKLMIQNPVWWQEALKEADTI